MRRTLTIAAIVATTMWSAPAQAQVMNYNGAGFAVPDNVPAGASATIVVPDSFTLTDVSLSIPLTHTWVGDLIGTLSNGTQSITLMQRVAAVVVGGVGEDANLGATYNFTNVGTTQRMVDAAFGLASTAVVPGGSYQPSNNTFIGGTAAPPHAGEIVQSFATIFAGTNSAATWTLTFSDNAAADLGNVGAWTLTLTGTPVPEPTSMTLCCIALAGFGWKKWRRRKA